jgi:hypothetical protein
VRRSGIVAEESVPKSGERRGPTLVAGIVRVWGRLWGGLRGEGGAESPQSIGWSAGGTCEVTTEALPSGEFPHGRYAGRSKRLPYEKMPRVPPGTCGILFYGLIRLAI